MTTTTLQSLLQTTHEINGVDVSPGFKIAVQGPTEDGLHIIVHPQVVGGEALDYFVKGDELTRIDVPLRETAPATAEDDELPEDDYLDVDGGEYDAD